MNVDYSKVIIPMGVEVKNIMKSLYLSKNGVTLIVVGNNYGPYKYTTFDNNNATNHLNINDLNNYISNFYSFTQY